MVWNLLLHSFCHLFALLLQGWINALALEPGLRGPCQSEAPWGMEQGPAVLPILQGKVL